MYFLSLYKFLLCKADVRLKNLAQFLGAMNIFIVIFVLTEKSQNNFSIGNLIQSLLFVHLSPKPERIFTLKSCCSISITGDWFLPLN